MISMSGNETFKVEDETILPGSNWPTIINEVRLHQSRFQDRMAGRGRRDLVNLGYVLSGALSVSGIKGIEIATFAEAAQPPMNDAEASALMHGFARGMGLLSGNIESHESSGETSEGASS